MLRSVLQPGDGAVLDKHCGCRAPRRCRLAGQGRGRGGAEEGVEEEGVGAGAVEEAKAGRQCRG